MIVSLIASLAGGLCGVGGGVVIKPALDAFGWASVSTIGFLSTCTVLAMTVYSVGKSLTAGDSVIDLRIGTPLALGSAIGGVAGKAAYSAIAGLFANPNRIGSIQAVVLGGVFGRMINKRIDNSTVEKLFLAMMVLIILICVYNAWQYSA